MGTWGHAIKNMSASPDLLWALTRKTNAFLVKRNGLQLSSDPNNIMGKHCFKFSGLANAEVVGVQETDAQRGITLTKKIKKNGQNPKKNIVAVDLKKGMRHVAKSVLSIRDLVFLSTDIVHIITILLPRTHCVCACLSNFIIRSPFQL